MTISLQVPAARAKLPKALRGDGVRERAAPPPTTTTNKADRPRHGALGRPRRGCSGGGAVKAAGATPVLTQQFNAAKVGTVVGTNPAQVKAGQTVQIIVSAGLPPIAYSDGKSIYTMDATNGKSVKIAASGDTEDEPTWQPNGSLVAYRRGPSNNANAGKIWMVDIAKGGTSARDMTAGPDDRRPAFAPNGKTIAFIRRTTSGTTTDGDLCFVTVGSTLHQGVCIKDPKFNVDRPTWSADGRAILVVAPIRQRQPDRARRVHDRDAVLREHPRLGLAGARHRQDARHQAGRGDPLRRVLARRLAGRARRELGRRPVGLQDLPRALVERAARHAEGRRARDPRLRGLMARDGSAIVVTQADNCNSGSGSIVRVSPSDSATQTQLRASGRAEPVVEVPDTPVTCSAVAAAARSPARTPSAPSAAPRSRAAGRRSTSSSATAAATRSRCR